MTSLNISLLLLAVPTWLVHCALAVVVPLLMYLLYKIITSKKHPEIIRYEPEKFYKSSSGKPLRFPNVMDAATVRLSLVVPSYNEEERLPVMMEETLAFLEKQDYSYEVIVVDDGSKDTTSAVAYAYTEKYGDDKVRVLTLAKNRGKGGAVRLGMMSTRGEYALMVDADGATRFSDLSKVFEAIDELKGAERIAVGSRSHLEGDSIAERSFLRTVLMKGFHLIVWAFCVRSVCDTQCGFKLLTRDAVRACFLNLHVERWAFDVELLYIAEHLHIPVAEVAVHWQEIDGSKVTPLVTWIEMGRDIFFIWLHYFLRLWAIKKVE